MPKLSTSLCGAAALLSLGATVASAQTYQGNGNSGFGGPLGNGTLTVTDDATAGTVTFSLATGTGGGFNDIGFFFATGHANLTGDATDGGNRVVTGYNGIAGDKATVNFAAGFQANFGLDLNGGGTPFATLYSISSTTNSVAYVSSPAVTNATGGIYSFTLTDAALGIVAGQSVNFVAYLLNPNSADTNGNNADYLSNETLGASNLGIGATLTFSASDTYVTSAPSTVPEPSTWAMVAAGASLLVLGLRRRSVQA